MVTDIIDWKNKSASGSSNETQQRNCILIQHKENYQAVNRDSGLMKSPTMLHGNYAFNRRAHQSFKSIMTAFREYSFEEKWTS